MNPYLHQPREVAIETIALCNARCTFCPYPTLQRKGERMSDELLGRLLEECGTFDHPFWFTPFKLNEALLDPRFEYIMAACEAMPQSYLRLFTNGQALTPKKTEIVARMSRVEHLWISLNATDPVEYERLMGIDFRKTLLRIDALHDTDFPHKVVISKVGSEGGREFEAWIKDRWPKFHTHIITRASWINFTDSEIAVPPNTPCGRWWEINIMSNGVVALCCQDAEGEFAIGDVNKQTILEVYNTWFFKERRQKGLSRLEVPVCKDCTY